MTRIVMPVELRGTRDEEIKSEYDKIKKENNYTEGKVFNNEEKSERDLFRVLVDEDGLVTQIVNQSIE